MYNDLFNRKALFAAGATAAVGSVALCIFPVVAKTVWQHLTPPIRPPGAPFWP